MKPLALLRVLQLADSGFPTGAFSFSHGLEGLTAANALTSRAGVEAVVRLHLRESFAGVECPLMAHAWRAATTSGIATLVELDALAHAVKPVPAYRDGSARTGRRLLEGAAGLTANSAGDDAAVLPALQRELRAGRIAGHHAVIFGAVMAATGVDEETSALAQGANFVNGLTAAAVRLGVIGATAAQQLLADMQPEIVGAASTGRRLPLDEVGGYLPQIDIMGLRQPTLAGRVFSS